MVRSNWIACVICVTAVLAVVTSSGFTATSCNISQVKVSSDLRRVVVKTDGPMKEHVVASLDKPPRLVIDIAGVKPGDAQLSTPVAGKSGLAVRVSATGSGSRLVLDFGGSPLPEYKIRRVENYLMVFLGDWTPRSSNGVKPVGDEPASRVSSSHTRAREQQRIGPATSSRLPAPDRTSVPQRPATSGSAFEKSNSPSDKFGLRPGALTIKSAQVIDDAIVLQITHKEKPGFIYRLELGLDLDRKRLNLAHVEFEADKSRASVYLAGKAVGRNCPASPGGAGRRVGPRKTSSSYLAAGQDTFRHRALSTERMAAKDRRTDPSVQGPRKNHRLLPSPAQRQPKRPLFAYWNTAATMFQENRGITARSIFPQVVMWGFYPTDAD